MLTKKVNQPHNQFRANIQAESVRRTIIVITQEDLQLRITIVVSSTWLHSMQHDKMAYSTCTGDPSLST